MVTISSKQTCQAFLAVTALFFMVAQPLWAAEETPNPQVTEEESFFQTIKEWFGEDDAPKAEKKIEKQASKESDGRKAINTFKKEMNRISDNVSESVERDKKTIKKKLDKLNNKK